MKPVLPIHYDPRLMEEAVFYAQRKASASGDYKKERSRIYEIADRDERDRLFDRLHRDWFGRLQLDGGVAHAIAEQPLIGRHIAECFVVSAAQASQEGAELFVAEGPAPESPRRTLRILVRPESLLDPEILTPFLRHELLHITDMLDPVFGYEPALPAAESGPTYDTLLTRRYRVLWDVTINGRMARRGWGGADARERNLHEFLSAFPMLGDAGPEIFSRFFEATQPRHAELAAFALSPRAATESAAVKIAAGTHCSLCRFPTHAFEPAPDRLGGDVLEAIRQDFPTWTPAEGLCLQCADLYRARKLSLRAARLLPGWNPHTDAHSVAAKISPANESRTPDPPITGDC